MAPRSLALLEAAVYASLDDDAPRLVYADALLEAGDPRGELIALQCRGSLGAPQRARVAKLMTEHGRTWLGPLAPLLGQSLRFDRGFLARCEVVPTRPELIASLVGHVMWSTVRHFAGPWQIAADPIMRSLRTLELAAREEHRGGDWDGWRDLLVDTPRRIETLRWHGQPSGDELAALAMCAALPALRTLTIATMTGHVAGALASATVLDRLATLGLEIERPAMLELDVLEPLAPLVTAARVPRLRLAIGGAVHPTIATLERDGDRYARARLEVGPRGAGAAASWDPLLAAEAIALIDALPGVAIELAPRRGFRHAEQVRQHLDGA